MATTSLDDQLWEYWTLLEEEEDKKSILISIKSLLENKGSENLTIEQYNYDLEQAEKRMDDGQYTSLENALKQSESW